MLTIVRRFAKDVTAPLMIDSTQLDVIEAGSTQGGAWPYKLVARAPNGKAIQTAPVELQAPDTDAAQAAGTTAPTPSSACA